MSKLETENRHKVEFYCDKDCLVIIDRLAKNKSTSRSEIIRSILNHQFLVIDGDIPAEIQCRHLEAKVLKLERIVAYLIKEVESLKSNSDSTIQT
jgi:hypothetical protein